MHLSFPSTSDQPPWTTALLSLLPFIIAGPLRLILSYQPGWAPQQGSLLYFWFLLLSTLVVAGGFILGIAKKFPRWAYPYAIFLAFSLYLQAMYAIYLFQWNFNGQSSFFVYLAAILIVLWLPRFRAFYSQILEDWTLLSYGLFGFVLYLLSTVDYDEAPRLTLLVLLPSLLTLGAALAHLRLRAAPMRIAVLLAGTFAGLVFSLLPIIQGMVSIWIGAAMWLFLMLAYGMVLTAILLAPMLVTGAIQSGRARRGAR